MGSLPKTSSFEASFKTVDDAGRARNAPESGTIWDAARRQDWDEFYAAAPFATYQQHYAYGEALEEIGVRLHRAQLFDSGRWIGAAQVQTRKVFGLITAALILRGPVWAPLDLDASTKAAAIEALRKSLPVSGLYGLIVAPEGGPEGWNDDGLAAAGYKRIMSGHHTVMLDLTADEETLRAALNGKWRNRLKAAEKEDIVISPLGKRPEKYAWLIERDEAQQKTSGYHAMPSVITRHYHERAGKGAVIGFAAQKDAERLGGMLFLRHGDNATYHVGWASEAGKAANVHNLLLWNAMRGLKKAGVRTLDLGGADTDANPGIARFKIGTGGRVLSLSGSWSKGPRRRPTSSSAPNRA